jgi:hypothetical protein
VKAPTLKRRNGAAVNKAIIKASRAAFEARVRQAQKAEAPGQLAERIDNVLAIVGGLDMARRRLSVGGGDI